MLILKVKILFTIANNHLSNAEYFHSLKNPAFHKILHLRNECKEEQRTQLLLADIIS